MKWVDVRDIVLRTFQRQVSRSFQKQVSRIFQIEPSRTFQKEVFRTFQKQLSRTFQESPLVVGRTPSRNFMVGGSSRSFPVLEVYIGVEAEEALQSRQDISTSSSSPLWCCSCTRLINLVLVSSSGTSCLDFQSVFRVPDTKLSKF